jgi:hypothetical protein
MFPPFTDLIRAVVLVVHLANADDAVADDALKTRFDTAYSGLRCLCPFRICFLEKSFMRGR